MQVKDIVKVLDKNTTYNVVIDNVIAIASMCMDYEVVKIECYKNRIDIHIKYEKKPC